jgi:hypothetical protein
MPLFYFLKVFFIYFWCTFKVSKMLLIGQSPEAYFSSVAFWQLV